MDLVERKVFRQTRACAYWCARESMFSARAGDEKDLFSFVLYARCRRAVATRPCGSYMLLTAHAQAGINILHVIYRAILIPNARHQRSPVQNRTRTDKRENKARNMALWIRLIYAPQSRHCHSPENDALMCADVLCAPVLCVLRSVWPPSSISGAYRTNQRGRLRPALALCASRDRCMRLQPSCARAARCCRHRHAVGWF